jgi:hypothetical protein
MANLFRRIYDWLLRLFWSVSPLCPSLVFAPSPRRAPLCAI